MDMNKRTRKDKEKMSKRKHDGGKRKREVKRINDEAPMKRNAGIGSHISILYTSHSPLHFHLHCRLTFFLYSLSCLFFIMEFFF